MERPVVRMRNITLSFLWVIYVPNTINLLHIAPTLSYLSELCSLRKPDSKKKSSEKKSLYMIYILIFCHENGLHCFLKLTNDFFFDSTKKLAQVAVEPCCATVEAISPQQGQCISAPHAKTRTPTRGCRKVVDFCVFWDSQLLGNNLLI